MEKTVDHACTLSSMSPTEAVKNVAFGTDKLKEYPEIHLLNCTQK